MQIDTTPKLVYLVDARKKYLVEDLDVSAEGIISFSDKVASGEVQPFLKSAPIPTEDSGPVKVIVGNNFKE